MPKRHCAYCGREEFALDKNNVPMKFSEEHIFPLSLAEITTNNPFIIDCVHEYCNNVSGMFIDAPVAKHWLVQKEVAMHASDFVNIEDNPILPLRYMGKVKGITYQGKICDVWHGPTGDLIYHFHKPYPEIADMPVMVGVPPAIRKQEIDNGFAFLFVKSNNPVWHPTIIFSFVHAFKKSVLYSGNVNMPANSIFAPLPDDLTDIKNRLAAGNHEYELILPIYGEARFMAKMALGFGAKLFGEDFIQSGDADLLRKFMWTKNHVERENIPVHGARFIHPGNDNSEFNDYFGWPGGHVITLTANATDIGLTLCVYNAVSSTIRMGTAKKEYQDIIDRGICYVIVPGLRRVVGPLKQIEFLNHRLNMRRKNFELSAIEAEMAKYKEKPPFRI